MFTDVERAIFGYSFRGQQRFVDPMAVRRTLAQRLGGDIEKVVDQVLKVVPVSVDDPLTLVAAPESLVAQERFWPAVRAAFVLPTADPTRNDWPSEDELVALWNDFQAWESKKNAPGENGLVSGPSTASRPELSTLTKSSTPCGCS